MCVRVFSRKLVQFSSWLDWWCLGWLVIFYDGFCSEIQAPVAVKIDDPKKKAECYGVFCLTYDLKAVSILHLISFRERHVFLGNYKWELIFFFREWIGFEAFTAWYEIHSLLKADTLANLSRIMHIIFDFKFIVL